MRQLQGMPLRLFPGRIWPWRLGPNEWFNVRMDSNLKCMTGDGVILKLWRVQPGWGMFWRASSCPAPLMPHYVPSCPSCHTNLKPRVKKSFFPYLSCFVRYLVSKQKTNWYRRLVTSVICGCQSSWASITKYHQLEGLDGRHYFSEIWNPRSPKTQCQ